MIDLRNKRVLVVGLARSGRAVASRLRSEGAVVTATDLRPPSSFGSALKEMMKSRIGFELGAHREETFLKQDLIVVSPGVPWDLPQLEAARRRKITVVPEVEAASWFFHGTLAGITGTNGKTTTTTLLGKMLEASGFAVHVAGNIGVPLISAVDLFSPDSIVVAELSSFQLEAIRDFHPHVAVLLNITENHLDRHRTFGAYVSAKAQIFRNQQPDDFALLNADDPVVMSLAPVIASRKVFFSLQQDLPEGVLLSKGKILYRVGHLERMLMEAGEIKLRGAFNIQNVMAAAAAACVLGADFSAIRNVAREFTGVEHRLEYVRTVRGVDFFNDSKATSVDAASKALSTFDRGVHLILGGKDKGSPYTPLRPLLEARAKSVYLIGSAADRIAEDLDGADLHRAGDLNTAVQMAFARAIPGDAVLLSPACSSYDQFENFEQRGRAFKEIVGSLPDTLALPGRDPAPSFAPRPAATGSGFGARDSGTGHDAGSGFGARDSGTGHDASSGVGGRDSGTGHDVPMKRIGATFPNPELREPSPEFPPAPLETTYIYETGAVEASPILETEVAGEVGVELVEADVPALDSPEDRIPLSQYEAPSTTALEENELRANRPKDATEHGQGRSLELFPLGTAKKNPGERR